MSERASGLRARGAAAAGVRRSRSISKHPTFTLHPHYSRTFSYHEDEEFSEEEAEATTAALPDARRGLEWDDDSTLASNGGKELCLL